MTLYRKPASCDYLEMLDALEAETRRDYGEMPAASVSCFAKARIKALAFARGVKVVLVAAANLMLEPVAPSREQLVPLKRKGGRYIKMSRRLMVSMRYFKLQDEDALTLPAIAAFISEL